MAKYLIVAKDDYMVQQPEINGKPLMIGDNRQISTAVLGVMTNQIEELAIEAMANRIGVSPLVLEAIKLADNDEEAKWFLVTAQPGSVTQPAVFETIRLDNPFYSSEEVTVGQTKCENGYKAIDEAARCYDISAHLSAYALAED